LKFLIHLCKDLGHKEATEYALKLKKAEKAKEVRERIGSSRPGEHLFMLPEIWLVTLHSLLCQLPSSAFKVNVCACIHLYVCMFLGVHVHVCVNNLHQLICKAWDPTVTIGQLATAW